MLEAWVESNILGPKAAEKVLAGKSYARGIRAHKLSLQAMWRNATTTNQVGVSLISWQTVNSVSAPKEVVNSTVC